MATLAELEAKIAVRDTILIGLIGIILGTRSADDLRDTLDVSDRVIAGEIVL